MTTGSTYGQILHFFDETTFERVLPVAPIVFKEDSLGAGWVGTIPTTKTIGIDWIKKLVQTSGSPSVGGVANGANGQVELALDSTSEKQEATLYFGDQKTFNSLANLFFEARVQLPVLPTGNTVIVAGVHSAWIDGPDNAAEFAHFSIVPSSSNALVNCESYDGTTSNTGVSSGVTITTTTEWHDLLIDFSTSGVVKFLIDGNIVAESTSFSWAATGTSAVLQPYFSCYKASGTGVGSAAVDFARLWQNR